MPWAVGLVVLEDLFQQPPLPFESGMENKGDGMDRLLSRITVGSRLILLMVLFALALVGVEAGSLLNARSQALQDRRDLVESITRTALAIVQGYHATAVHGKMTEEQAKTTALTALRAMRYGNSDYVWVNDRQPRMIMHPIKPELEGKDLSENKDPSGKKLFVAFVEATQNGKSGFVDYLWPKPGASAPVSKISFVTPFDPWGWVIGTGLYLDDVVERLIADAWQSGLKVLTILLVTSGLAYAVVRSIRGPLHGTTAVLTAVANGNIGIEVQSTDRRDEIGEIARAVQVFKEKVIAAERFKIEVIAHPGRPLGNHCSGWFFRGGSVRRFQVLDPGHRAFK